MPKTRWIEWDGDWWRLSDLARRHEILPQTLASRIARGYDLDRALATGLCCQTEAGKRGFSRGWGQNRA